MRQTLTTIAASLWDRLRQGMSTFAWRLWILMMYGMIAGVIRKLAKSDTIPPFFRSLIAILIVSVAVGIFGFMRQALVRDA